MRDRKTFHRDWSTKQKELRELFKSGEEVKARDLFMTQHAFLHSREVSGTDTWSYPDQIFEGLDPEHYRLVPKGRDHSLTWILWHISRIEDITMNVLVAGGEQLYLTDGWKKKLLSPVDHTGNAGPDSDIAKISSALDPDVLLAYRNAIGCGTRRIVQETPVSSWNDKVRAERLERLVEERAVLPEAEGLLAYWSKRRIYELFLMPPTRHLMSHLNEAKQIRDRVLNQISGT